MLRSLVFKRAQSSLIVNPLEVANAHIIRESSSRFAKPAVVSFDGFGTLWIPRTPVPEQYQKVASSLGVDLDTATIESRFKSAYSDLQKQYPIYGKGQLKSSDAWWKLLVNQVFQLKDEKKADELSTALIQHFLNDDAYKLYDDVIPCLDALHEAGVPLVLSSNTDPNVYTLLHNLGLEKYFGDNVFISYELGVAKPDRRFFTHVAKTKYGAGKSFNYDFLENCWHVGDSFEVDFVGSVKSGWNGVLLDRHRTSEFFVAKDNIKVAQDGCFMSPTGEQDNPDMLVVANNRIVIGGLDQIPPLFGIQE
ncbi:hypothetical protein DIURU_000899 [Diutina rugosa]|uniref:Haloacid dehalogenase-like hydrolase domain-containing protein 3 n=1 Tax=Diutina rugosa TaxID=5481 RepID=A0A642UW89_DIURU|nr:uncharacterized protein DIURU_000899 [Diutina rugosa]KAA8906738.1 hypothetical protein DIURU_000899 [Diutina rugosa]